MVLIMRESLHDVSCRAVVLVCVLCDVRAAVGSMSDVLCCYAMCCLLLLCVAGCDLCDWFVVDRLRFADVAFSDVAL